MMFTISFQLLTILYDVVVFSFSFSFTIVFGSRNGKRELLDVRA
jgi:hypothetical protein